MIFLPEDKVEKILDISKKLLKQKNIKIRNLASLIGVFCSSACAILLAPLFHRYLDIDKIKALRDHNDDFDAYTNISEMSKRVI